MKTFIIVNGSSFCYDAIFREKKSTGKLRKVSTNSQFSGNAKGAKIVL